MRDPCCVVRKRDSLCVEVTCALLGFFSRISNHESRITNYFPILGRLRGEGGASPPLSRNCDAHLRLVRNPPDGPWKWLFRGKEKFHAKAFFVPSG